MRGSDMTTDSKKNIVKLILFGIISLLLIIAASAMMNPTKWFDEKLIQDRNSRTVQMMEQPDNTIDILNLGDSLSTAGFSPMELWRDQGYTSFNIGADGLRMAESYYSILNACKEQTPKVLLIESLYLFRYSLSEDTQIPIRKLSGGSSGTHLLIELDTEMPDAEVKQKAAARGIYVACLSDYCSKNSQSYEHTLILNYSELDDDTQREAIRRLGTVFMGRSVVSHFAMSSSR